jgi:hypothetical protein
LRETKEGRYDTSRIHKEGTMTRAFILYGLALALLGVGCQSGSSGDDDGANDTGAGEGDTDSDGDGDTDGDTDSDADADSDGDSDTDGDSDGDMDGDADTDTFPAAVDCDGGKLDPSSNLCWQNPLAGSMQWQAASDYCDGLSLAGHDAWRLPTIGELRSLVRGCAATETGGVCGVTDDCLGSSCWGGACDGCGYGDGPANGCYWPAGFEGECGTYWTSSANADDESEAWTIDLYDGLLTYYEKIESYDVRCLRPGP